MKASSGTAIATSAASSSTAPITIRPQRIVIRYESPASETALLFRLCAGIRCAAASATAPAACTTAGVLVDGPTFACDPLGGCFRHRPILVALCRQRHFDRLVAGMAFIGQQDAAVEWRQ